MRPLTVLVLNSGGSSVKCQICRMPAGESLAKAQVERVGQDDAKLTFTRPDAPAVTATQPCPTHLAAIEEVLALLHDDRGGTVPRLPEIDAVGHRVVHAGEAFTGSVAVSDAVLEALEACSDLAPLHNPPNLAGIRACQAALPGLPQVAVFDNALHHTLAPEVWHYALPRQLYEQHRVRRYGFHGVAFRSMLGEVETVLRRPGRELRVVQLMLGSGCTANALRYGESISISTGFTPLEGLVQSTRCGDLDAGAVLSLLREGRTAAELNELFNRASGLKGLSGISADLRDILAADTADARLAVDVFVHRLVKYVGGYTADLGGLDVLAFGGGIGQHAAIIRQRVCEPLEHLGIRLDPELNEAAPGGRSSLISGADSPVAVVVCAVDEELVIARDTYAVVTSAQQLPGMMDVQHG